MNARVEYKSGEELVNVISENVGRMLRRKMDAVTCIRIAAESWDPSFMTDGNFSYVSGKCSHVIGHNLIHKKNCEDSLNKTKNVYKWVIYSALLYVSSFQIAFHEN